AERIARALGYLARRGELEPGTWQPAAELEVHPALPRLGLAEQRDLGAPSERMCWFLAHCNVERPDQLSKAEASAVAHRLCALRWASNPARGVERRHSAKATARAEGDDDLGFAEWVQSTNDEFAAEAA